MGALRRRRPRPSPRCPLFGRAARRPRARAPRGARRWPFPWVPRRSSVARARGRGRGMLPSGSKTRRSAETLSFAADHFEPARLPVRSQALLALRPPLCRVTRLAAAAPRPSIRAAPSAPPPPTSRASSRRSSPRPSARFQGGSAAQASPPPRPPTSTGFAPVSVNQTTQRFPENALVSIAALTDPTVAHGRAAQPRHDLHGRPPPALGRRAGARRARHRRALLRDPAARRLLQHVRLRRPAHHRHAARAATRSSRPASRGALPAGVKRIQSPTNLVWVLGRTLVKDAGRHAGRRRPLMGGYRITALDAWTGGAAHGPAGARGLPDGRAGGDPDRAWPTSRSSARSWRAIPPPKRDACALKAFAQRRHRAGRDARPTPTLVAAVRAGKRIVARAERRADRFGAQRNNGWLLPGPYIGAYGRNYLGRAVIATAALGANTRPETVYPLAVDDVDGRPLSGRHRYTIRFPRGQLPPANAFWSVTIYGKDRYLVPQPDRPLRDRRPHQGTAPGPRRLAHDLRPAPARPRGAAARQLAARAERQLPARDAHLRAAPQRAHGRWLPPPLSLTSRAAGRSTLVVGSLQ